MSLISGTERKLSNSQILKNIEQKLSKLSPEVREKLNNQIIENFKAAHNLNVDKVQLSK